MNSFSFNRAQIVLKRVAVRLSQAVILALVVTMALPVFAAGERAVKTRSAPIYPELARRMKIAGAVVVEATVDASGQVVAAKTLSGNLILAPAAEDAVRKWTFESGTGSAKVTVEVNFVGNN
jgi:TonB family protein